MNTRRLAATRRLAHLLLERATGGGRVDAETAARLVDTRLLPTAEARREVAREALALGRAAARWLAEEEALRGELRANVRIALRDRAGAPFSVAIPSLVLRPDGTAAVLVIAPAGDRGAEARARRYRFAAERLEGRRTDAYVVGPDGALSAIPRRRRQPPRRSEPSGAPSRGRGCSPSDRPQSGRTRR